MSGSWILPPGLFAAGLIVLVVRKMISPMRFAQALGALALAWSIARVSANLMGSGRGG